MKKWYLLSALLLVLIAVTGAVLLWLSSGMFEMAAPAECGKANRRYVEDGLSAAFGTTPQLLDGSRCLKTAFSSDMVAMAELAPDFAPEKTSFSPGGDTAGAPLGLLDAIYPEIFKNVPLSEIQISNSFSTQRHINVHLLRLRDGRLFVLVSDMM